jgi:uncharacterized protein HemX
MLGNIDPEKLKKARIFLEGLKDTKLALVTLKHLDDNPTFHELRRHLADEVYELRKVGYGADYPAILEELADVSNMVDIMVIWIREKMKSES